MGAKNVPERRTRANGIIKISLATVAVQRHTKAGIWCRIEQYLINLGHVVAAKPSGDGVARLANIEERVAHIDTGQRAIKMVSRRGISKSVICGNNIPIDLSVISISGN